MSVGNSGLSMVVADDGSYLVWPRAGSEVQRFASDGTFLGVIGRSGEGPGELMALGGVATRGDRLYVTDVPRSLVVVFTLDGQYVSQHRIPFWDFWVVADRGQDQEDRLILASHSTDPRFAGFPLHLFDPGLDSVLHSTGSLDGRYVPAPYDRPIVKEPDPSLPGMVWLAQVRELRFERWNVVAGRLENVVGGEVEWFPPVSEYFDGTSPPHTLLRDFLVDGSDRLWVLTSEPDPDWEDNVTIVTLPTGRTVLQTQDPARVRDMRLRVFDLTNRTLAQDLHWDRPSFGLARSPQGDAVLYEHVVDLELGVEKVRVRHLAVVE